MRWLITLLFLCVGALVATVAVDGYRFLTQPVSLEEPAIVTIPEGVGFNQVLDRLDQAGLFKAPRYSKYMAAYAAARGMADDIKSGEYEIAPDATPLEVLHKLVAGNTRTYRLTIIPGWQFSHLRKALARHDAIKITLAGKSPFEVMDAIGAEGKYPEGWFLPNTYFFPRGTTDVEILTRAYHAMQELLAAEWANRESDLPLDSPYEALILASIVEEETALPNERPRVAGVFISRLEIGMRLQADPTVIYGMEHFNGNIRLSDLQEDTPYNTYQNAGLPPTPIALPSAASIHAALHPSDGDALYFVATGNGGHEFSETYAQHQRAVRKYQKEP